jgi:hypothetical protein
MTFRAKTFAKWSTDFHTSRHPYRCNALAHATAVAGFGSLNRCLDKIVLNHRRDDDRPSENILDAIMRAVEHSGQVTLPVMSTPRYGWKVAAGIAVGLAAIAALAVTIFR